LAGSPDEGIWHKSPDPVRQSIALGHDAAVMEITEKLGRLRERIDRAAQTANRDPRSVTIVAVSKGQPVTSIAAAVRAGQRCFGENYLREALPKVTALREDAGGPLDWHFIGALQANKTRAIAETFGWAQTVTSLHVAERLSRQRPPDAGDLQVCVQLRPAGGPARAGVPEADVVALAAAIANMPRLKLRGLMFMPLPGLAAAELQAEFERAYGVFEGLRRQGLAVDTLSMGMSADLEPAIAAGSTLVRIGTALFGARPPDVPGRDQLTQGSDCTGVR
jgi:hypothetical protein